MKTRVSWVKVCRFAGVTVLISGLLLLGAFRNSSRRAQQAGEGHSHFTASETARLFGAKEDHRWIEAYGKLPLSFEQNVGQTAQEVRYVSHGAGYELFLAPQEAVLAVRTPISYDFSPRHRFETARALREASRARTMTTVRMHVEGANPAAKISGIEQLLKITNYFIGSDPQKWHTNVPSYGRVKYADIYPGVDLIFYGNQRQLEYDFVVAPGADPKAIALKVEGAKSIRINSRGDLVLSVAGGEVELRKPVVYQSVKGERREIAGKYVLAANRRVTFAVGSYDRNEPLILDPVLNYSTYLGGSGNEGAAPGLGIVVDSSGNAYVAGTTFSTDFPTTTNGFDPGPAPASVATNGTAFVTEMNPTGTAELYSTYLAGSTGELGVALALDPSGKIYVTGQTFSSDFPTTSNALKQSPNAANLNLGTSFISKIDPSINGTNSLVYSSYIGGTGGVPPGLADFGNAIAADANGNAYVTGITFSSPGSGLANFPVLNAFQTTPTDSANGNAFLTRIDTTKSGTNSLIYSTYLGGTGANAGTLGFADAGFGVAVDSSSNAYIVGATASTDFPTTTNALQTTAPAAVAKGTAFVSRIDTTKSGSASLVYSTYLGGEASDFGVGVGLGPNNVAYTTGSTSSLLFPTTTGAFQTTGNAAHGVAFVSLVDTGKTGAASLQYSTFLGGTNGDTGNAIRADGTGNAYVVGATSSADFPVTSGSLQPLYPGAQADGFVTKISPGGSGAADLAYSTFFGGSGGTIPEQGFSIALDGSSPPNAYITGQTSSTASSFPVFPAGAFQTNLKGASDAFVAKLTLIPTLAVSPTSLNFGIQPVGVTSTPKTVTLINNTSDPIPFPGTSIAFIGSNKADFASPSNTCGASIPAGASCNVSVTFTPSGTPLETATLVITVTITDGGLSGPQSFDISLSGTGSAAAPGVGLAPTTLAFGGQLLTTTSAAKTVTLTNTGNAALTINSIAGSGDFAATSTGAGACPISPATLPPAPGANTCTINVTFAPTAVGARAGTLTITDNAGGSPQTVPLTGTGWDFSVAATTPPPVKAGKSITFTVTMTPLGGFNQAVTLACAGAPKLATCTPAPTSVTAADGVTPQTSTVTVTTKGSMLPPTSVRRPPLLIPQIVPLLVALILVFFLLATRRLRMRLGVMTAILILMGLVGCAGGPSTPKGQSTLTITATSGTVSKTAQVTLTVN